MGQHTQDPPLANTHTRSHTHIHTHIPYTHTHSWAPSKTDQNQVLQYEMGVSKWRHYPMFCKERDLPGEKRNVG